MSESNAKAAAPAAKQPVANRPHARSKSNEQRPGGFETEMLALNRNAGNGAVSRLLAPSASGESLGPSQPISAEARRSIERWAGPLPPIGVHNEATGEEFASAHGAHAATRGWQIAAEHDAFEGMEGRQRLAHEAAHSLQQTTHGLPFGSRDQVEADADAFAANVTSGQPATVRFGAPLAWYFDIKDFKPGDTVVSLSIARDPSGKGGSVVVTMKRKQGAGIYRLSYGLDFAEVPAGKTYDATKTEKGLQIQSQGKGENFVIHFSGAPDPNLLVFPNTFPVTVTTKKAGSGGGSGGKGKGEGKGAGKGTGAKGDAPKTTDGGTPPPGTAGKSDGDKSKGATGGQQDPAAVPPPDAKVPVIQVSDLSQIEKLKAKGLIEAKSADEIKAKLEKQEPLTFDEAMALIDALDRFAKPDPDKKEQGKESWYKWAKYITENKEKISGRAKSGGPDALTVDEVKEILDKHNEFVASSGETVPKDKRKPYDPEKNKAWNDLPQWQKDLWRDYRKRKGDTKEEGERTDPNLTDADLFSMALNMSPDYMPAGARAAAIQLFTDPIFIGSTIVGIGIYLVAISAPEPIISKSVAVAITVALLAVFSISEIKNLAVAWMQLSDESSKARSIDELDEAAEHFGKAVGGVGLRVLVMIATILLGKALPGGPKAGGGGLGAPELALEGVPGAAAAPAVAEDAAIAIKVLKDGTIVIVGPGTGALASSSKSGGGGPLKPSTSNAPSGGSKPSEAGSPESKGKTPEVKKLPAGPPPEPQKMTLKQSAPPEGFEDIFEQEGMGTRKSPGGRAPSEGSETGNFAHKWFEKLEGLLKGHAEELVSEKLPAKAEAEYPIKHLKDTPNPPRIDRLDRAGETVIEIKPKSLKAQGEVEAKGYAEQMDKVEPLPDGRKWKWKCVTYDYDKVIAFLKEIGYLPK